jgi:aromatic ring-opening dioxygenase LigB subunit
MGVLLVFLTSDAKRYIHAFVRSLLAATPALFAYYFYAISRHFYDWLLDVYLDFYCTNYECALDFFCVIPLYFFRIVFFDNQDSTHAKA